MFRSNKCCIKGLAIKFHATRPFAIKVFIDGRNVLTGLHADDDSSALSTEKVQDYVVVPGQSYIVGGQAEPVTVRRSLVLFSFY